MTLLLALSINLCFLGLYLKSKDIRFYYLVIISVVGCALAPLYFKQQVSPMEIASGLALTTCWALTSLTYCIHKGTLQDKIYWSFWGATLTIPAIIGPELGLFWTIFLSSQLYILFQSKFDDTKVRNWMLLLLIFDLSYIFLSPALIQSSNNLLAPPLYINELQLFLAALVPLSLCLKILGHSVSYIKAARDRMLCLSELVILCLLFFYKFAPDLYIDKSVWRLTSIALVIMACLILMNAMLNKKISFETVAVLLMLKILAFISNISIYELNSFLLILPIPLVFIQFFLLKKTKYFKYSVVLNTVLIPVLTIQATTLPLGISHVPLLLFVVAHTTWLYLDYPLTTREDYAT